MAKQCMLFLVVISELYTSEMSLRKQGVLQLNIYLGVNLCNLEIAVIEAF